MRELRRRENQSALSEAEQSRRLYRLTAAMPTAEEYSRRANETYILVKQTQDIWECEAVLYRCAVGAAGSIQDGQAQYALKCPLGGFCCVACLSDHTPQSLQPYVCISLSPGLPGIVRVPFRVKGRSASNLFLKDRCAFPDQMSFVPTFP
jgi:hypothetical protein